MIWATRIVSLLALAASLPFSIEAKDLDVWAPEVTVPHAGDTWTVPGWHWVGWDASNPPRMITNPIGEIYLQDAISKTLLYDWPGNLASVALKNGGAEIWVPKVPAGQYQIVLIGDSGNSGPIFTIKH